MCTVGCLCFIKEKRNWKLTLAIPCRKSEEEPISCIRTCCEVLKGPWEVRSTRGFLLRSLPSKMADPSSSSSAKEKKQYLDKDGYVHDVSDIKIPPSGVKYFDFKLQERSDVTRVVCFSPPKRNEILLKQTTKSPVKLQRISPRKRKYEPDSQEYIMNSYSKVSVVKNLSFPWANSSKVSDINIEGILSDKIRIGEEVTLTAKVLWKSEAYTVYSNALEKELRKCDVIIADCSGAMFLTVWEDCIKEIKLGVQYLFGSLKLNFFTKKFLNFSKSSTMTTSTTEQLDIPDDIKDQVEMLKPAIEVIESIEGRVLAIDIKKLDLCPVCKSRNDLMDDVEYVQCTSCNMGMMKENMVCHVSADVVISDKDGASVGRFTASTHVLNTFMASAAKSEGYNIEETDVKKLSKVLVTQTILQIKKMMFKISQSKKVIHCMEVQCMEDNMITEQDNCK